MIRSSTVLLLPQCRSIHAETPELSPVSFKRIAGENLRPFELGALADFVLGVGFNWFVFLFLDALDKIPQASTDDLQHRNCDIDPTLFFLHVLDVSHLQSTILTSATRSARNRTRLVELQRINSSGKPMIFRVLPLPVGQEDDRSLAKHGFQTIGVRFGLLLAGLKTAPCSLGFDQSKRLTMVAPSQKIDECRPHWPNGVSRG